MGERHSRHSDYYSLTQKDAQRDRTDSDPYGTVVAGTVSGDDLHGSYSEEMQIEESRRCIPYKVHTPSRRTGSERKHKTQIHMRPETKRQS